MQHVPPTADWTTWNMINTTPTRTPFTTAFLPPASQSMQFAPYSSAYQQTVHSQAPQVSYPSPTVAPFQQLHQQAMPHTQQTHTFHHRLFILQRSQTIHTTHQHHRYSNHYLSIKQPPLFLPGSHTLIHPQSSTITLLFNFHINNSSHRRFHTPRRNSHHHKRLTSFRQYQLTCSIPHHPSTTMHTSNNNIPQHDTPDQQADFTNTDTLPEIDVVVTQHAAAPVEHDATELEPGPEHVPDLPVTAVFLTTEHHTRMIIQITRHSHFHHHHLHHYRLHNHNNQVNHHYHHHHYHRHDYHHHPHLHHFNSSLQRHFPTAYLLLPPH